MSPPPAPQPARPGPRIGPPERKPGRVPDRMALSRSVWHPQRRRQRPGHVDLPELGLVLGDVVRQGVQQPLHGLGAVDHARPHHRFGGLRLHIDEIDDELGLVVVEHRHVDVHALSGLLVDLELDLDLGLSGCIGGHARLLASGPLARKRLRPCGEAVTAARRMVGPADPFVLGEGPDACLLLHGLTGSPAEMRPVGEALAAAGFRAGGPLLPRHGTTPEDLDTTTRFELLDAARSALLSLRGARQVFLCGLSAGALLTIQLAARGWAREGLPCIPAIALLAPALE